MLANFKEVTCFVVCIVHWTTLTGHIAEIHLLVNNLLVSATCATIQLVNESQWLSDEYFRTHRLYDSHCPLNHTYWPHCWNPSFGQKSSFRHHLHHSVCEIVNLYINLIEMVMLANFKEVTCFVVCIVHWTTLTGHIAEIHLLVKDLLVAAALIAYQSC